MKNAHNLGTKISIVLAFLFFALSFAFLSSQANAGTVLLSKAPDGWDKGYGLYNWTAMTAALDNATGNQITVVSNFENLTQMLSYDAIWLDHRGIGGTLTPTETSNINAFINTGRRVVMTGDHVGLGPLSSQILGIVGGSYCCEYTGVASSVLSHELTNSAPTVYVGYGAVASGGEPLYSENFATLWGGNLNVLTVLDINIMADDLWNTESNAQFNTNVANWIAYASTNVPVLSCSGFESPMASGPVKVKKNRVLPLKAQLFDAEGLLITDAVLVVLPVLQVLYDAGIGGDPVDVTDDAMPAGQGTDGNQFVFTDDMKWQFNMKTKNYTAPGTYSISMVSGDDSAYMIDPMCEATFIIN